MPMTVGELLANPALKLEPLVAGAGAGDRAIRWVHASEMPDPSAYLRGDEIVLSAGIWHWAGSAPHVFVGGLARAGAAGIGFGPSALVPEVPAALIEACADAGLTLFSIPDDVPFIAVIEAFVERYVEDRERALLDAQWRNEELVACAQERGGVRGVLRVLARHRRGSSWVVDHRRGLLGWTGVKPSPALVAQVAADLGRGETAIAEPPGWTIVPIVPAGVGGALAIEDRLDAMPAEEGTAIAQAAAFLAIEFQRDLAVRESERRFAAELVDLIAAGEMQLAAATARLEAFGLDPEAPLVVVVGEVENLENGIATLERLFEASHLRGVVAIKGVQVVSVVAWRAPVAQLPELAQRMRAELGSGTAIGVGGLAAGMRELRRSLIEAQQACRFAHRGASGYAIHTEIGSHALLLALQDDTVLSAFREALLRPLLEHDARRHTDLVATLERFLESGGAYQSTADALHVHVNTLRQRLARIEELTGRRLADMESRVDFFIALRSPD